MNSQRKSPPTVVAKVLSAWKRGPYSLRIQCENHQVPYWQARYWVKQQGMTRSRRDKKVRSNPSLNFLELDMSSSRQSSVDALFRFPSGVTLSMPISALAEFLPTFKQSGLC